MKKSIIFIILTLICLIFSSSSFALEESNSCDGSVPGISNPAAVYCQEMGYTYEIKENENGQYGVCNFDSRQTCDAWEFLEGKCGQEYSYCAKNGYNLQVKDDGQNPFSSEYAVCVKGRTEVGSVVDLINLNEKVIKGKQEVKILKENTRKTIKRKKVAIPFKFDWRNYKGKDWITYVKDQGSCGSCWAFAAIGVVEAAYNIQNGDPNLDLDLAEQYLVSDCLLDKNCCGGTTHNALNYLRNDGVPDEQCMPYWDGYSCSCFGGQCSAFCSYSGPGQCSDYTCGDRCDDWDERLTTVQDYERVGAFTNPISKRGIKESIIENGPHTAYMQINGYFDEDGIYKCTNPTYVNHAVVIVGYNDFERHWIVKNSFGSHWQDDGYFNVGYGQCLIDTIELDYIDEF